MQRRFVLVGSVLVLLALLAFLWSRPREESLTPELLPASPSEFDSPPHTPVSPEVAPLESDPVRVQALPTPAPLATTTPTSALAEVKGRILLPGGAPAAGVALELHGWAGNTDRARRLGVPKDFVDPEVQTGDDGRFSLRLDPPRAFQFVLEAEPAGFVRLSWRFEEIAPSAVVDVGDVVLERGGIVRARVVDKAGKVLSKGWVLYADAGPSMSTEREPASVHARPDPTTGDFVLGPLPPGSAKLRAQSEVAGWIPGPSVEVRANEEVRAEVLYDGPDLSTRITVVVFTKPFYTFTSSNDFEFVLSGPIGVEKKAVKLRGSSQSWVFEDLTPGSYRIELRGDRFEPWSKDGVETGSRVDARLRGNAAVMLTVLDEATGAAVSRYALDVRFDDSRSRPNVFRVFDAETEPPPNGFLDGMMPGNQTLIVTAAGRPPVEIPVANLLPRETRTVNVTVAPGRTLTGRVRTASGRGVAGVEVSATPPVPDTNRKGFTGFVDSEPPRATAITDEHGAFALAEMSAGAFVVTAKSGLDLSARVDVVVPTKGEVPQLDIVFPDSGRLVGRLLAPERSSFDGLAVIVLPVRNAQDAAERHLQTVARFDDARWLTIGADGEFASGPLPAGEVDVTLVPKQRRIPTGERSWTRSTGPAVELERVRIQADVDTRHDFDVRANFPATCEVRVSVQGVVATGALVTLMRGDPSQAFAGGVTDERGSCTLHGIPAGPALVVARAVDGSWTSLPMTVTLTSNGALVVPIDVDLAAGEVLVRVGDPPSPLTNTAIMFEASSAGSNVSATARTDSSGVARVSLPAGRWNVRYHSFDERVSKVQSTAIDWAGGGRIEVDLKPEPH